MLRYLLLLTVAALWALPAAAGNDPAALLPTPSCGAGWSLDGKVLLYDRETLSDRIDGEAELFFPYGFQILSYGRYLQGGNAFDVDVYRMGGALDAFGMYAGYRPEGAAPLKVGTDGAVTSSQLFFYQDRYFVRLQSTGSADAGQAALTACAAAVSRLLPLGEGAPKEIGLLAVPEVEKSSIRYSATSLLGYDFFPRGMLADAVIAGEPSRVFVFLADSPAAAGRALDSYLAYLKGSGSQATPVGGGAGLLTAIDPLYGRVLAGQTGRYVFGLARVKDGAAAVPVLERLRLKLAAPAAPPVPVPR